MSKYNSKKVEFDGITFDSKVEAEFYKELQLRKMNGEIKNFSIQPKYVLIPKFTKNDKNYREMTYTPDFLIEHLNGSIEAIDIKGFGNQSSEIRKKLFDYFYRDVKLIWLSYSKKYGGWLEYDELIRLRKLNKREK